MRPPYRHYKNLLKHSPSDAPREPWFVKYWRAWAAWIYLGICIFDFVIMPLYMSRYNVSVHDAIVESSAIRAEDRITALSLILKKNTWAPLTLAESGMFHLAFGAILGVAAWTRGQLQTAQVQNGIFPGVEEPAAPKPPNFPPPSFNTPPPSAPTSPPPPGPPTWSAPSPPPSMPETAENSKYTRFDTPD